MKRFLILASFFFGAVGSSFALGDKAASAWSVKNVSVSTTTVTAIPTTALTGRSKIIVQNLDSAFDLYIGTSTSMTTSNGFVVTKASSTLELPVPQGLAVYGIGQANGTSANIDVRIIEYK